MAERAKRRRENIPLLKLFTLNLKEFDWFRWGDIFYVITCSSYTTQAFFYFPSNLSDDDILAFHSYTNLLWLLDSLIYFTGYMVFLLDMRRSLVTGIVPVERTAAFISEFIGDNYEDTSGPSESSNQDETVSSHPTPESSMQRFSMMFFGSPPTAATQPINKSIQISTYQNIFQTDKHGYVTVKELRNKLKIARDIRIRKTQATMRHTDIVRPVSLTTNEANVKIRNQTSPIHTSLARIAGEGGKGRTRNPDNSNYHPSANYRNTIG